jgi:hypothetical protein
MAKGRRKPTETAAQRLTVWRKHWPKLEAKLLAGETWPEIAAKFRELEAACSGVTVDTIVTRLFPPLPDLVGAMAEAKAAERADLARKLAAELKATPLKEGLRPQTDRVLLALPKLGNIDGISEAVLRQKLAKYLQTKVPDRKTMNYAIRQYRNRAR